eukprot:g3506.t1
MMRKAQPRTSRGGGGDISRVIEAEMKRDEIALRQEATHQRRLKSMKIRMEAKAVVEKERARIEAEEKHVEEKTVSRETALQAALALNELHSNKNFVYSYKLDPSQVPHIGGALKLQPSASMKHRFKVAYKKKPTKILSISACYERISALSLDGWSAAAVYLRMTYLLINPSYVDGPPKGEMAKKYYKKALRNLRESDRKNQIEEENLRKFVPKGAKGRRELERRQSKLQDDRLATWQLQREAFEGLFRLHLNMNCPDDDGSRAAKHLRRWFQIGMERPVDGDVNEEVAAANELRDLRHLACVIQSSAAIRAPDPKGMEENAAAHRSLGPLRDFLIEVFERLVYNFKCNIPKIVQPLCQLYILRRDYKKAHSLLMQSSHEPLQLIREMKNYYLGEKYTVLKSHKAVTEFETLQDVLGTEMVQSKILTTRTSGVQSEISEDQSGVSGSMNALNFYQSSLRIKK